MIKVDESVHGGLRLQKYLGSLHSHIDDWHVPTSEFGAEA